MFKQIELINFQSHKHTVLDLKPGINVITGKSHVGKSSIFRAIRWVVFNRPLNVDFLSFFAKKDEPCIVRIVLDSGDVVERIKGKNLNLYKLNGTEFKAIRTDVPKEIKDVLRITDINLQPQHNPYFLIGSKPSEVMRVINTLIGLDVAQELINIGKNLKSGVSKDIKYVTQEIARLRTKHDELQNIYDDVVDDIAKLEKYHEKIEDYSEISYKLEKLLNEIYTINCQLDEYKVLDKCQIRLKKLDKLKSLYDSHYEEWDRLDKIIKDMQYVIDSIESFDITEKHVRKMKQLEVLHSKITKLDNNISSLVDVINELSSIDRAIDGYIVIDSSKMARLEKLKQEYDVKNQDCNKLADVLSKLNQVSEGIERLTKEINKYEHELTSNLGDICPLCKQPINKEVMNGR